MRNNDSHQELRDDFAILANNEIPKLIKERKIQNQSSDRSNFPTDLLSYSSSELLELAKEVATALIFLGGVASGIDYVNRLWKRVSKILFSKSDILPLDEFVLSSLIFDEKVKHPFGLSSNDISRKCNKRFTKHQIRNALIKLSKHDLAKKCNSQRVSISYNEQGIMDRKSENIWFYSGPGSKYSQYPDIVLEMYTPIT